MSQDKGANEQEDDETLSREKRDILLPEFGDITDVVNDVARSILNAVTIYIHR